MTGDAIRTADFSILQKGRGSFLQQIEGRLQLFTNVGYACDRVGRNIAMRNLFRSFGGGFFRADAAQILDQRSVSAVRNA